MEVCHPQAAVLILQTMWWKLASFFTDTGVTLRIPGQCAIVVTKSTDKGVTLRIPVQWDSCNLFFAKTGLGIFSVTFFAKAGLGIFPVA